MTTDASPPWAGEPELGVFINCPFDRGYQAAQDAIIFAVVQAGFFPWMAGSTGSVARPRVQRILEGLTACRYSIHDLTRYRGEGDDNLARFNMPLELGMAMSLHVHPPSGVSHEWMVMVPEGHAYQRYISDLAGYDPLTHDGTAEEVAVAVFGWLATQATEALTVGPEEVVETLPRFTEERAALEERWKGSAPWRHVIGLAVRIARQR